MKFVYLIFLILLSLQTIAQVDTSAQWIELKDAYEDNYDNYFRQKKIILDGKQYNTLDELDAICRRLLNTEIQQIKSSAKTINEHTIVPRIGSIKREIRWAIDNLNSDINAESIEFTTVSKTIESLKNNEECIITLLYLYEHYRNTANFNIQGEILGDLYHEMQTRLNEDISSDGFATCHELLGDYWQSIDILVSAQCYKVAYVDAVRLKDYAKLASISTKLAILFSLRCTPEYDLVAAKFYEKAEQYYNLLGDRTGSLVSRINAEYKRLGDWYLYSHRPEFPVKQLFQPKGILDNDKVKGNDVINYFNNWRQNATNQYNDEVLSKVYDALYKTNSPYADVIAYNYLGHYYLSKQDDSSYNNALKYYYAALIQQLKYRINTPGDVLNTLVSLSNAYSKIGRENEATFFNLRAGEIARASNDTFLLANFLCQEANLLNNLGKYREGLNVLKNVESLAANLPNEYNSFIRTNWLREKCYLYSNLKTYDSSNYYSELSSRNRAYLLDELHRLNEVENSILESEFNQSIKERNKTIQDKDIIIAQRESYLKELQLDIQQKQKSLQNKNWIISSQETDIKGKMAQLLLLNDSLKEISNKVAIAKKQLAYQEYQLKKKDKRNRDLSLIIAVLVGIVIISTLIYRTILKIRTQQRIYTEERLRNIARAKIHNIQNNYTSFTYLASSQKNSPAYKYADYSSDYIGLLLETWNEKEYTLAHEIDLLDLYSNAENILIEPKNVVITKSIDSKIDIFNMRFIPEILTTLYNNSVTHGFKENHSDYKFHYEIKRINSSFVEFTIVDNGRPDSLDAYLKSNRPNSGLNILKERIINENRRGMKYRKSDDVFSISTNNGSGTIIKFSLPYATK